MKASLCLTMWAAIRRTEGREWIDNGSLSLLRELAQEKADRADERIPSWTKDNPVIRIAQVTVTEIQD